VKHSQSIAKLAPALVAAQEELKAVAKDASNPHFNSKFASLNAIIAEVRPVLAKHGLASVQGALDDAATAGLSVETMLIHSSGEWISGGVHLPLQKADPQGAGAAMTYGRRFGLSALLSLATEDDDDGHTASRPAARQRAASQDPRPRTAAPNSAQSGEATPAPASSNGSKRPEDRIFKGATLGSRDKTELEKILKWARTKGVDDLATAIGEVLNNRVLGMDDDSAVQRAIASEERDTSRLPF
jgi:hypothetical protein